MGKFALLAMFSVVLVPATSRALSSDFEYGLDGWSLVDVNGNSAEGDLLSGNQPRKSPMGTFSSPTKALMADLYRRASEYLGDWTEFDGELTIHYDHRIVSEGLVPIRLRYEIRIEGPGGEASAFGINYPRPRLVAVHDEARLVGGDMLCISGRMGDNSPRSHVLSYSA